VGKLDSAVDDIFSFFGSFQWTSENIATYPQNFVKTSGVSEFIRLNVILGPLNINRSSATGILKIEIYTVAGQSVDRAIAIGDKLNSYLENKTIGRVQFTSSSLYHLDDATNRIYEDPTLFKSIYSINFNFFGVN